MKAYYSLLCGDCRDFLAAYKDRNCFMELINITENTDNLKEFLRLRDTSPAFDEIRKNGGIGIPAFVEGSSVTFDIEEALNRAVQ